MALLAAVMLRRALQPAAVCELIVLLSAVLSLWAPQMAASKLNDWLID